MSPKVREIDFPFLFYFLRQELPSHAESAGYALWHSLYLAEELLMSLKIASHPSPSPISEHRAERELSPCCTQLWSEISARGPPPPPCSREDIWTPGPFLNSISSWQTHSRQLEEKKERNNKKQGSTHPNDSVLGHLTNFLNLASGIFLGTVCTFQPYK